MLLLCIFDTILSFISNNVTELLELFGDAKNTNLQSVVDVDITMLEEGSILSQYDKVATNGFSSWMSSNSEVIIAVLASVSIFLLVMVSVLICRRRRKEESPEAQAVVSMMQTSV